MHLSCRLCLIFTYDWKKLHNLKYFEFMGWLLLLISSDIQVYFVPMDFTTIHTDRNIYKILDMTVQSAQDKNIAQCISYFLLWTRCGVEPDDRIVSTGHVIHSIRKRTWPEQGLGPWLPLKVIRVVYIERCRNRRCDNTLLHKLHQFFQVGKKRMNDVLGYRSGLRSMCCWYLTAICSTRAEDNLDGQSRGGTWALECIYSW